MTINNDQLLTVVDLSSQQHPRAEVFGYSRGSLHYSNHSEMIILTRENMEKNSSVSHYGQANVTVRIGFSPGGPNWG